MSLRRGAYRVDLEVPGLARGIEVNNNLLILETKLLEGDVSAVGPGAEVVCVEDDLGRGHVVLIDGRDLQECNAGREEARGRAGLYSALCRGGFLIFLLCKSWPG